MLLHSHTQTQWRLAPSFSLPWVDGREWSLTDFSDKVWVAVIFICNHCPFAVASWPVMQDLASRFPDIWFIAISSNDAQAYPDDGFPKMKELSNSLWLSFPYLYDEDQSVAKAYDAQCTPDNYLFKNNNWSFELFYHGRFVDNRQDPSAVKERNFEDHIQKLLADQSPAKIRPTSMGCSIKWK